MHLCMKSSPQASMSVFFPALPIQGPWFAYLQFSRQLPLEVTFWQINLVNKRIRGNTESASTLTVLS